MRSAIRLSIALPAAILLTACGTGTASPPPAPATSPTVTVTAPPTSTPPAGAPVTTGSPPPSPPARPGVDLEAPLPADVIVDAPTALGPLFTTGEEPLPAQTTGALRAAGGEALTVNDALDSFGLFAIPRPSGTTSAVMEATSSGTLLADGTSSSLSGEVVYMISSSTPIEDLLAAVAATMTPAPPTAPTSIPDYDGSTGDPRCARLPVDLGSIADASVEGCEYRADPLTEVRTVAVRRLNLPVHGPSQLPAVFAPVPAELLTAGATTSFSATFGRPTGPAGNTIQLEVRVRLSAAMPALGGDWQPDGPNRWWNGEALVTVDAGTAIWTSSTRVELR